MVVGDRHQPRSAPSSLGCVFASWCGDAMEIQMSTACHTMDNMFSTMPEGGKRLRSTSHATPDIHFFPFHSAQLIILLAPFLRSSNVTEMFPPSPSVAIPGQVLLTFYGFLSVLSAINGDLCLGGKAFDLTQPEEKSLSAFDSKVKFTLGCFFWYRAHTTTDSGLLHSLCGGVI